MWKTQAEEQAINYFSGAISGVLNTVTYLGVTIGVCVFETIFSQIIHQSGSDQTLASPGFTVDNLYAGFRYIFAILGFLSIVGMIFSYLPKMDAKRKAKEVSP